MCLRPKHHRSPHEFLRQQARWVPQAKKLLWRINKAIAKDLLPTEPQALRLEPWWVAHVVNLGEGLPFLLPACSSAGSKHHDGLMLDPLAVAQKHPQLREMHQWCCGALHCWN